MIAIKNRFTGKVIHSGDFESVKDCLIDAIQECANLECANLRDANLWDANLECANLRGANLRGANLRDANLRDANLWDASLECANLRGANLRGANLRDANLRGANLEGANLECANLEDANLECANLRGANLWGCAGNNKEIKSIWCIETYLVSYTATHIQIGCEKHKISEWESFDDKRIIEMEGRKALSFWRDNKNFILSTVNRFPAKPTGKEND